MKAKKIQAREERLARVRVELETRKKALQARGADEKGITKDSTVRHLLAEISKIKRSIESLQWEPPPRVEKAEKPAKEAAQAKQPKTPKPPKEKKPKKEKAEEAPPA